MLLSSDVVAVQFKKTRSSAQEEESQPGDNQQILFGL